MEIRPATADDYSQLMDLYNGFVNEDRYSGHDNDSFKQVLESKTGYIFVAEVNSKLHGFITYSIRHVVRYPKPIAEIDELFVSITARGKGLGSQLIKKVELDAKERDCYRIYVESHYDHTKAHKLYEKLAFANYGYHFVKNVG